MTKLPEHLKMNVHLTASALRAVLDYNSETGEFTWRQTLSPRRVAGSSAGHRSKRGYVQLGLHGVLYNAHRLAWLHFHGRWPPRYIDHINGDGTDNRITNLREATASQNGGNSRGSSGTGHKGVYLDPRYGTYFSRIKINRKAIHLGTWPTLQEACNAYARAARQYFGEFARIK